MAEAAAFCAPEGEPLDAAFLAEGDPLRGSAVIGLAEGPAALLVRLDHAGPGPRLRLGWSRPWDEDRFVDLPVEGTSP